MNLSPSVKKYFVNALKGIGLVDTYNGRIMSNNQIAEYLDQTTTDFNVIFNDIQVSIQRPLLDDMAGDENLNKATAFNCNTVSTLFTENSFQVGQQSIKVDSDSAKAFISSFRKIDDANFEPVTQAVVDQLISGVKEQKYLNDAEKVEAISFWEQIRDCAYYTFLSKRPNLKPNQDLRNTFYGERVVKTLKEKIQRDIMGGDAQKTDDFLDAKIDDKARIYLEANCDLLKKSEEVCRRFQHDPQTELKIGHVLLALGEDYKVKEVINYFQERSQAQRIVERDPRQKEVNRENKIGNLMGKESRKQLAKMNGGLAVYSDTDKVKKGKTNWRGYKALYDRISNFMSKQYESVQAIGYIEAIMKRKGYLADINYTKVEKERDLTKLWQTNLESEIPTQYLNDNQKSMDYAGEFYHETKARLLADKMRLKRVEAQIAESALIQGEDLQSLEQISNFLQNRIKRAGEGLDNLARAKMSSEFEKPEIQKNFTAKVENYILYDAVEKKDNDNFEVSNDGKEIFSVEFMTKISACKSANDDMIDALQEFQCVGAGTTASQKIAKISMARELFGLQNNEIEDKAIDEMADRFLNTECQKLITYLKLYKKSGADKAKKNGTHNVAGRVICKEKLKSDDYRFRAIDANAKIKEFVTKDLQQNYYKNEYRATLVNQARSEILQGMTK